jgi:hypothetical protein
LNTIDDNANDVTEIECEFECSLEVEELLSSVYEAWVLSEGAPFVVANFDEPVLTETPTFDVVSSVDSDGLLASRVEFLRSVHEETFLDVVAVRLEEDIEIQVGLVDQVEGKVFLPVTKFDPGGFSVGILPSIKIFRLLSHEVIFPHAVLAFYTCLRSRALQLLGRFVLDVPSEVFFGFFEWYTEGFFIGVFTAPSYPNFGFLVSSQLSTVALTSLLSWTRRLGASSCCIFDRGTQLLHEVLKSEYEMFQRSSSFPSGSIGYHFTAMLYDHGSELSLGWQRFSHNFEVTYPSNQSAIGVSLVPAIWCRLFVKKYPLTCCRLASFNEHADKTVVCMNVRADGTFYATLVTKNSVEEESSVVPVPWSI